MKAIIKEFSKAQVSSLISTACDFMTTAVLFKLLEHVVISTASGAVVGGMVNCIINYTWTFKGSKRGKKGVVWRYALVWLGSIVLNTAGTEYGVKLVELLGNHLGNGWSQNLSLVLIVKAVVAIAVGVFWNFTMQKYFVYKKK